MNSIIKSSVFSLTLLILVTFVVISATNRYILTVNFYDLNGNYLAGNPAQETFVFESLQKWIYLSTIIYLLLKLFIISLILYTALYLNDQPVDFSKTFKVVIRAEFLFLIPAIVKMIWFHFGYKKGTLEQWQNLYILSPMCLVSSVPPDWYYALQTFNLFEVAYWFVLAYGISKITIFSFDRSLRLVVYSYLPALFIWVAFIAFCTLLIIPYNQ